MFLFDQPMKNSFFVLVVFVTFFSCRKKVEIREVEVEKKYSWTESKRFSGTEKIFLSSGSDGKTIYLQQPFFFTALTNQNELSGITVYGAGLPTNIDARIPISPSFSAFAASDTILRIINNAFPVVSPSGGYINLKAIDPTLTAIQKTNSLLFKAMSINANGVLLLTYANNRPSQPLTFMMLKIKTNSSYPYVDTLYSKVIAVPTPGSFVYARHFAAVNDYFLADLSGLGIYKFKEDGSFTKVHNGATVDAFYEWQGKVYAHAEWGKLLISSDQGVNWQEYSGITNSMVLASYHTIKDSLIGTAEDNIFTLKWNNSNYSQRLLKNDGLEGSTINGLEILNDTVYAATTKGLFFKPLSSFFESK
jgi:hypothetical protein